MFFWYSVKQQLSFGYNLTLINIQSLENIFHEKKSHYINKGIRWAIGVSAESTMKLYCYTVSVMAHNGKENNCILSLVKSKYGLPLVPSLNTSIQTYWYC